MQKKVIALAVAALASGAAMAQSNVTLYGLADAAVVSISTNNEAAGRMKNQRGIDDGQYGARLGFKGEEALGGGLKAEFLWELGVQQTNNINQANVTSSSTASTGANQNGISLNALSTRQSYIALTSQQAGQIAMGRFQTPGWDFQVGSRPWGGIDPLRSASNLFGMSIHTSDRISNAVQYTSPTFSGFKVKGLYASDASNNADLRTNDQVYVNGTVTGRQAVYYVSGYYDQGPISAQLIYRKAEKTSDNATDNGKYEWGARGSYDFGVAKVGASYHKLHLNAATVMTTGNYQQAYYYAGYVTVPVGAQFNVSLEGAKGKGDQGTGTNGYSLIGQYLFSKRTDVYAMVGRINMNSQNGNGLASTTNFGSYGATPIEAGKHANAFLLGMAHKF